MARRPNKLELLDELTALVEADFESAARAERAAHEGATHEQAKPENDKDTRALEQSYLARGQSARVEELRVALGQTRAIRERPPAPGGPIALGALVEAEEDEATIHFLMAPARGGTKLQSGVQVVTPSSPLGRALLGKRADDEVEIAVAKRARTILILRVD